ncbi:LysE family translocator [Nitratidesulfovibrio liaohensis]|uniref:LysE family translocator n=1 Tax=Nitratidesulfovibrio liaohensis TaxID=2604158 RepID=A0ABY9R0Y8_9BACT|nr:LysE family translocator [Nitratidesulfovibrio liaohensis]WMW64424.1 LysE family translocator [Nitratidesulfovibrio liaohensis]
MAFGIWFTYFLLMTAIAYTPGPMTMFSMSTSVRNGFARTVPAILGGSCAYCVQMVVVYFGLGAIVQGSVVVFNCIKWVGVAYLVVLALKNWRSVPMAGDEGDAHPAPTPRRQFCLGFATGMSNPKSILVFTVLFPQFIEPAHYTAHFCILAGSFFVIQGSSAVSYALFGARVFRWLRRRSLEHVQHKATAVILFGAAGMLAASRR